MNVNWIETVAWLGRVLLGGGLLLLLVYLVLHWVRQPARRQWLGDWGLMAALVMAGASLVGPTWLVLNWSRSGGSPEEPPAPAAPSFASAPWMMPFVEEAPTPDLELPPLEDNTPPQEAALDGTTFDLSALAVGCGLAYLAMGMLLLTRWLVGHVALLRLLRRAEPAPAELIALLDGLAMGQRRPRLLVSSRGRVPMSCGLWRPTIVLPEGMSVQPDLQQLRWVLAHEWTHLERRDAWSGLLFGLGQGLFWGLPWFWWLRRQVRLCQEYIADAAATGSAEPAADYADFLLGLAGAPAVSLAATGVSGNGSDLFRRITMLLQNPLRIEKQCPRRWSWAASVALLALAFVGAGVGFQAEAADTVIIVIGGQDKDGKQTADKVKILNVPVVAPKEGGKGDLLFFLEHEKDKVIRWAVDPTTGKVMEKKVEAIRTLPGQKVEEVKDRIIVMKEGQLQLVTPFEGAGQPIRVNVQLADQELDELLKRLMDRLAKQKDAEARELRKALEQFRATKGLKSEGYKVVPVDPTQPMKNPVPVAPLKAPLPPVPPQPPKGVDGRPLKEPSSTDFARAMELFIRESAEIEEARKRLMELEKQLQTLGRIEEAAFVRKALEQLKAKGAQVDLVRSRPLSSPAQLGLKLETPNAILADQLNLPKNRGLVVAKVEKGSLAERAGFKANDVIVEIAGLPISAEPEAFAAALESVRNFMKTHSGVPEAKSPKAAVRRKGNTIHLDAMPLLGLEAAGGGEGFKREPKSSQQAKDVADEMQKLIKSKTAGSTDNLLKAVAKPASSEPKTSIGRTGKDFVVQHVDGPLVITLTGTYTDGKAKVSQIIVNEGREPAIYTELDRVPQGQRQLVRDLMAMVNRLGQDAPGERK